MGKFLVISTYKYGTLTVKIADEIEGNCFEDCDSSILLSNNIELYTRKSIINHIFVEGMLMVMIDSMENEYSFENIFDINNYKVSNILKYIKINKKKHKKIAINTHIKLIPPTIDKNYCGKLGIKIWFEYSLLPEKYEKIIYKKLNKKISLEQSFIDLETTSENINKLIYKFKVNSSPST